MIAVFTVSEPEYVDEDIRDLARHGARPVYVDKLVGSTSGKGLEYSAGFLRHLGMLRSPDEALGRVAVLLSLGVPIVNDPLRWLYANSKLWIYAMLASSGVPVPCVGVGEVVKPDRGFMGIGVRVGQYRAYKPVIRQCVVRKASEYRVVVVGQSLGVAEKLCNGFKCNVAQGASMRRVDEHEVEKLAEYAVRSLGLEIAGVDVARDVDGRLYVLDVNATFSWQGFKRAVGIDVADEIIKYLKRF